MNLRKKLALIILAACAPLFHATVFAQIDAGTISVIAERKIYPIAIKSTNANVQNLASRAFMTHGAFKVGAESAGGYVLNLNVVNETTISASVGSVNVTGTGATLNQATLKACDEVVRAITKQPGYFSGRLVFVAQHKGGGNEVCVGDMFFQEVKPLTNDNANCAAPRWFPDGSTVFYASDFKGGFDIYKANVNSGARSIFASYNGTNYDAVPSPDGSRIAFISTSPGNAELYLTDVNNRNPRRVTKNKSIESAPTWSPDGSRMVVCSDGPLGKPQLCTINLSNGALQRIQTNLSGYCAEPRWNRANGNLLAFTVSTGGQFQVAVYDFQSRQAQIITSASGDCIEPVWTADGRHLVYTSRRGKVRILTLFDTITGKTSPLHSEAWGNSAQADYLMR